MKELVPGYNPINGDLEFTIELNLFKNYFSNFEGLIKMNEDLSKCNAKVRQVEPNKAVVAFPVDKDSIKRINDGTASVRFDNVNGLRALYSVLNSFTRVALKKELKSTEFIPLNGYPVEDLKNDIHAAVKGKRKLCIIDEYDEYLRMQKENNLVYHQYIVDYGTSEYADDVLLILDGNMDELRKRYSSKLEKTEWC